jgi:DNA-binding IscR family transcriptional regulator
MRPPGSISAAEILAAVDTPDARRGARFRLSRQYQAAVDRLGDEVRSARRSVLRRTTLADLAGAVHDVSRA